MARISSASLAFAVLFLAGSLNVVVSSLEKVTTEGAAMAASSGSPAVVTAPVGGTAYLSCNVSSTSDSVVVWRREKDMSILILGDLLVTRERRFRLRPEFPSDGRMVQIDSVKIEDSGDYVCFDSSTPTNQQVVHLSVIEPLNAGVGSLVTTMAPSRGSPAVVTAAVGSTAYLSCNVSTTSGSGVGWGRRKDMNALVLGRFLVTKDMRFRHRPEFPSDGRNIQIQSVKIEDSGDYMCFDSSMETNQQVVHLSVVVPEPRTKIVGEPTRSVVEGASVNLTCVIEPSPATEVIIEWTRDTGEEIFHFPNDEDTSIIVERGYSLMSTLLVNNIRLSESGNYTCTPSEGNSATITVHVTLGQFGAGTNEADLSTSNVVFSEVVSSSAPEMTTEVARTSDEKGKLDEFETEETRGLTLTEVQRLVMLRNLKVLALQEDVSKLQIQVLHLEKEKLLQTEN